MQAKTACRRLLGKTTLVAKSNLRISCKSSYIALYAKLVYSPPSSKADPSLSTKGRSASSHMLECLHGAQWLQWQRSKRNVAVYEALHSGSGRSSPCTCAALLHEGRRSRVSPHNHAVAASPTLATKAITGSTGLFSRGSGFFRRRGKHRNAAQTRRKIARKRSETLLERMVCTSQRMCTSHQVASSGIFKKGRSGLNPHFLSKNP